MSDPGGLYLGLYLGKIFHPQECQTKGTLPVAKRLFHYLGRETDRLKQVNLFFYQHIRGRPLLASDKERYIVVERFRRQHVTEIFQQTGWQIKWIAGKHAVQAKNLSLPMAYSLKEKSYVFIKLIPQREEYEIQHSLIGAPHILPTKDLCSVVDPFRKLWLYQVTAVLKKSIFGYLTCHRHPPHTIPRPLSGSSC